METKFQTSFIPKAPLTGGDGNAPKKTMNFFVFISILIFVLSLLGALGTYLYLPSKPPASADGCSVMPNSAIAGSHSASRSATPTAASRLISPSTRRRYRVAASTTRSRSNSLRTGQREALGAARPPTPRQAASKPPCGNGSQRSAGSRPPPQRASSRASINSSKSTAPADRSWQDYHPSAELLPWIAAAGDTGSRLALARRRVRQRAVDGRAATRAYQACSRSHFGSMG